MPTGYKHTAASKVKMSKFQAGRSKSAKHRASLSKAGMGRVTTQVAKDKMSVSMGCFWATEAGRKKMVTALRKSAAERTYKPHSMKCCAKLSLNSVHRKLTAAQAKEIYRRVWNGESGNFLAETFNISVAIISQIKHKSIWRHIH